MMDILRIAMDWMMVGVVGVLVVDTIMKVVGLFIGKEW